MIGADDRDTFFDPDEFGVEVQIVEPGQSPRTVCGMWGLPLEADKLRRSQTSTSDGGLRIAAGASVLQLFNSDAPANWREAMVVADDRQYSMTSPDSVGRLRTAYVLVPYGDRNARQAETEEPQRGRWIPPRP